MTAAMLLHGCIWVGHSQSYTAGTHRRRRRTVSVALCAPFLLCSAHCIRAGGICEPPSKKLSFYINIM